MKQTAQRIFRETLAAIDVSATIEKRLARDGSCVHAGGAAIDLREYHEIVAIAFGKASFSMARGLNDILAPGFPPDGILVTPAEPPARLPGPLPGWKEFMGGHPEPNEGSFAAGRAILDRLARCDERTLIFFLISGGGSSLVEWPLDSSWTLGDFRKLNSVLVTCGAPIQEINAVRKRLSAIKGGRLAAAAPRSMKVTLAIGDVPAGQESALASGPTLPDSTTIRDAERIIRDYRLLGRLPDALRAVFQKRALRETPKESDSCFARARFELLLGARDLLHAAHRACEAEGFVCLCDNLTDNWPVEKAAAHLLAQLELWKGAHPGRRAAVLCDGELSSPVTGGGTGGRNSAFVLACVPKIAGKNAAVLSAGTDGIDGNSPAAGAVADGETLSRAAGLDPGEFQRRSGAYDFFVRLGDAVVTGPTGNNLRDLRVLLMA